MNLLRRLRSLVVGLCRRDRFENRMTGEIGFHIEAHVEELVRTGIPREEATRKARLEFGSIEHLKEECREARGLRFFDESRQDLSYAIRSFVRNAGFAMTAVVTLALGIGATTAIFSVVYAVLLRPLPFRDPDRIVRIVVTVPRGTGGGSPLRVSLSMDSFREVRAQSRTLSDLSVVLNAFPFTVTGVGDPFRMLGSRVSPSVFSLLGVEPKFGRVFSSGEDTPGNDRVVILSHRTWERYFGSDPNILGRTLRLNDNPYSIIGVMPDDFRFPQPQTELWVPFVFSTGAPGPPPPMGPSIARIVVGVSLEQATAEIQAMVSPRQDSTASSSPQAAVSLVPIQEQMVSDVRPALLVLLASVVAVLMIACVNVANLMMTRASNRRLEIAVRFALGAGRIRLLRQLLTESLALAGAGCLLGLVLAYLAGHVIIAIAPGTVPRLEEVGMSGAVMTFAIATSMLSGLLFGIVPALRLPRSPNTDSLNEGRRSASTGFQVFGRNRMRSVLVVAEVAMAIVLLVSGGLLIHSFANLARVGRGYDPTHLLTFSVDLPRGRYAGFQQRTIFYEQLFRGLSQIPGVAAVAGVTGLPLSSSGIIPTIGIGGREYQVSVRWVTPDYLKTLGIQLVEGRMFTDQDPPGAIVVNETFATRYFPSGAVGHQVTTNQNLTQEIVGVVGDVRQEGLQAQIEPEIHFNYKNLALAPPGFGNTPLSIAVRTLGDPMNVVQQVRRAMTEVDRTLALGDVQSMEQRLYSSVAGLRFYAVSLGIFAAIALALASIGIYGVLSFAVSQRTREIGIRLALGAPHAIVMKMILSQGMKLAMIGTVAGLVGAIALTRYLQGMLFGLTPLDPATFLAMTSVLILTALLACYLPARRAVGIDPTTALRHE